MKVLLLTMQRGYSEKKDKPWASVNLMGMSNGKGSEVRQFWVTEAVADSIESQGLAEGIHEVKVSFQLNEKLYPEISEIERVFSVDEDEALSIFEESEE